MQSITKQDAGNLLRLIDRALKNSPQSGGIKDHFATQKLIDKLVAIAQEPEVGEQDSDSTGQ